MKKRNVVLQAAVAAALVSTFGAAYAGSISTPSADSLATKYAAEALTGTTVISSPAVVYTMGVDRTTAQDFTMIFTPSPGATFVPANCLGSNFVAAGAGAATITTKRASATECAIEVDVTTAFTTSTTITASAPFNLATHPLATAGGSVSVTLAIKDLGETAFIDNSGPLSRVIATSVNAINVYAAAVDTATIADVNATAGPLKGFLANSTAPADTATVASATLSIDNNTANAKDAAGANFDFRATAGKVTIVLTDANTSFAALKASKLCADLNSAGASACDAAEVFTVAGNTATLTSPAANNSAFTNFPAQGTVGTTVVTFQADGTNSLGTTRTIAVTGNVTPVVGAAHAFANTASSNAGWWKWSANAIELWTPYFATTAGYISRFVFQNVGTTAATYSTVCLAETGNVVTAGAKTSGSLDVGMTVIAASDVCTFSGNSRGNVRFIINAPAGLIHGTYNVVHQASGVFTATDMTRPYANPTY